MPDTTAVWIGKLFKRDKESGLYAVMIRGIFCTERDALAIAPAFECDTIAAFEPGQQVKVGEVVLVELKSVKVQL